MTNKMHKNLAIDITIVNIATIHGSVDILSMSCFPFLSINTQKWYGKISQDI